MDDVYSILPFQPILFNVSLRPTASCMFDPVTKITICFSDAVSVLASAPKRIAPAVQF